jgi:DNA-binding beta-propeller fold protein YncE
MLTFSPDGTKILVANEGEPRLGIEGVDPAGSVTIVTLNRDAIANSSAITLGFGQYDSVRSRLIANDVVLRTDVVPSVDFEPEFISVTPDGDTAYVALQEANSIAVLDLSAPAFTGVYGLGEKQYGGSPLDILDDGEINIVPQPDVYGLYLPDGIALHETGGKTYILTTNEGDSRADWEGFDDEVEAVTSPTGNVTMPEEVVWYNAAIHEGLNQDHAYIFGGRSFSVWEMTDSGPILAYDSGSQFEELTALVLPTWFNCSNDDISLDDRSGKKGPEPEYVTTGVVNGKAYAFIALERTGGVMVYDISDIKNISFVNYINSREFGADVQGDVAPEGLSFIPAAQSVTGNAQLLAACEVSGTVAVYEMK